MGIRSATRAYRLQEWAALIQQQQESGLNKLEWCAQNGYSRDQYFYWQRQLRITAIEQSGAMSVLHANSVVPAIKPSTKWISVETESDNRSGLVVSIGCANIRVDGNTDMGLLSKVCGALSATISNADTRADR